jgi:hypothetical protein
LQYRFKGLCLAKDMRYYVSQTLISCIPDAEPSLLKTDVQLCVERLNLKPAWRNNVRVVIKLPEQLKE